MVDAVKPKPKPKRKRRRSPGGLGRGLARILTDNRTAPESSGSVHSGLLQLVGAEDCARSNRIRSFVVETALGAIADAFALDGVALVAQTAAQKDPLGTTQSTADPAATDRESTASEAESPSVQSGMADDAPVAVPTFLAARLPTGWSTESPELFEIYGNLWHILQDEQPSSSSSLIAGRLPGSVAKVSAAMPQHWQQQIGRQWVLLSRIDSGELPVASVAIRKSSFSEAEIEALGAVIGSVVTACSDSEAATITRQRIRSGTSATLKSEGDDVLAEVRAEWDLPSGPTTRPDGPAGRRTGLGRGSDPAIAVARAAAKACRPRCEVAFAGNSELEGVDVSIVMISHPDLGLRLGFAVRERGDYGGTAEAVFTAAH